MSTVRRPKLGQHFLTSDRYRLRVAEALPIGTGDLVIEIGAGRGAMTGLIAERAGQVVAVELDASLAEQLKARFGTSNHVEILQGDILELDIAEVCRRHGVERAFVFGNLPYYITSPILHRLLQFGDHLSGMAFVVQREVALRIAAKPGSRDYGYLSVLVQTCTCPRVAFSIPPGAFTPPPAVFSAFVTFDMSGMLPTVGERSAFLEFVKLGFGQKRKKLSNNLSSAYGTVRVREALRGLNISENARAEQLAVIELEKLFEALKRQC
ncbi:MAG TPA: 16S rRNA (adenine(1518)-N(6)/adenine(1519)-N(6))-dimethyltransferase RsmA [Terriglobia bacterium]|nr:16S rRNA (adenine(1518)-N(6)/adenine(1519)-N(6))-dimethyltransferase RsmA [Terriglobia bacterium]